MNLSQISANDALTQGVISRMRSKASVLLYALFYSIVGNAAYVRKASAATGGTFRALGSDYSTNTVTPAYDTPALKILGDKVQVDQAHERRGEDIPSVRARDLFTFADNLGKQFQLYFFNGDADTTPIQFNGIKKLCPSGQKITASTNGQTIGTGNSDTVKGQHQKFLELLDQLIGTVDGGAEVLFMDDKTLARLSNIARDQVTVAVNEFGIPQKFYSGIPVLTSGFDNAGNRIIGHAESCGTGNTCTSVYAVRFGAGSDLSIATNRGVEVSDLGLVANFYTHRVEMDAAISLLNDKAVARLEGLIIA